MKEGPIKILVLGGCGIQGKTILYDLSRNEKVHEVVCADIFPDRLSTFKRFLDMNKVRLIQFDASDKAALVSLMKQKVDTVIDVLPTQFIVLVARAALEAGVNLVNTNYAYGIRNLHQEAEKRGTAIMPECGLDPGIDLVLYHYGIQQFDEVHVLNSYCGGIPEKKACTNALNYKISWNWDSVLKSQKREAVAIKDGKGITLSAENQHDNALIHEIDFPGLGRLEAFPNGNAVFYTDLLGITPTLKETGRYSLRWPGWSSFWRVLKQFQFLSDESLTGFPYEMTPHQFMVRLMEPQLQYKDDEKDLAVMKNVFIGMKGGRRKKLEMNLLIERDLETGLMAMSMGVGYPASIVACMIANEEIKRKGVLSPAIDIPCEPFLKELAQRGLVVQKEVGSP